MIVYCTTPIFLTIVVLICLKLDDYFQKQKFKKLEKELKEMGMDKETITIARYFFTK